MARRSNKQERHGQLANTREDLSPAPLPACPPARLLGRWHFAALLALPLLAAGYLAADWWIGIPENVEAAYVGRQSCIDCHQPQAASFEGSFHDRAMDLATPETVLGDFSGVTLEHHGIESRMFRKDDKYFIHTEGPDGEMADFEIKYVFGVDPLQQYMVELEEAGGSRAGEQGSRGAEGQGTGDRRQETGEEEQQTPKTSKSEIRNLKSEIQNAALGRVQVLRVSWDTHNKRWFHLDPPDVKERLSPGDDLHWTGISQRWNTMCADCHSTNLQKNFDTATGKYHTTFSEIDVSCEACHGPGSVHVQLAHSLSPFWDRQRGLGLAKLKTEQNIAEIETCAQCHSRRRVLHPGYRPGQPFHDFFASEGLSRLAYHADGSNLDEVYEYGSFAQSKMFHKNVRCSDCHDPHSTQLKFSGNKVCTSCHQHPASKYDSPEHHHHKEDSTGASCVECHMPETTFMDVDARRDHGMRVPRPDLSVKFGTPNACTQCHVKESGGEGERAGRRAGGQAGGGAGGQAGRGAGELASGVDIVPNDTPAPLLPLSPAARSPEERRLDQWCAEATAKWYKPKVRKEDKMVPALTAARTGHPSVQKSLVELVEDRDLPAIVRATAVMELSPFARPETPALAASAAALADASPQVRAAAIANLEGLEPAELRKLGVPLLKDPSRLVRSETARVLARIERTHLKGKEHRDFKAALEEYFTGLDETNDRVGSHLARGATYEQLGELDQAEQSYRLAMRIDPNATGPRSNLAGLLERRVEQAQADANQAMRQGDREQAVSLMDPVATYQALAEQLRQEELELLQRDAQLAPNNGPLQHRLGLLLYLLGKHDEAETALTKAVELEPNEAHFRFMLALLLQRQRKYEPALVHAEKALELWPSDESYQQVVAQLREAVQGVSKE